MATGTPTIPDRNLALELVRVTEAASLGSARWIGRGDKESADQAAVDAMRHMLQTVTMAGVVVIGEGEKDEAPMLYNGEEVGNGEPPEVDVAVDPLEGTRLTALGQPNAIAVIAVAERGTMFFPGAAVYMDKIACGAEIAAAWTSRPHRRRTCAARRRRKASSRRTSASSCSTGSGTRRSSQGLREVGARGAPDHRRRRRTCDRSRSLRVDHRPHDGYRGYPGGRHRGCRREVPRRRSPGEALARNDGERQELVAAGYDLDRVLTPTTWSRARTSSSRRPASPTAPSCMASATRRKAL